MASKLYKIRLCIAGETHEFYRKGESPQRAKHIAISTLETKLKLTRGSLHSAFDGTRDNCRVTEVIVTKHNQIKETT